MEEHITYMLLGRVQFIIRFLRRNILNGLLNGIHYTTIEK